MRNIHPLALTSPAWDEEAWLRWTDYLTLTEQKVYKALRERALTGHTDVDLRTFASYVGVRKAALAAALLRLESIGLLEDVSDDA